MWIDVNHYETGLSHIEKGIPCQDRTYSLFKNDVYVVALSDGAGSRPLSHFGAEAVTKGMCEYLVNAFDDLYKEEDFITCRSVIINQIDEILSPVAKEYGCNEDDLACTFLLTAVKDDCLLIMHCGDGVIGYVDGDDLKVATKPTNGEFANFTVFVTPTKSNDREKFFRIVKAKVGNKRGFIMMSDGPENAFYNKRKGFLVDSMKRYINCLSLLPKEDVYLKTVHLLKNIPAVITKDDKSIVFLANKDEKVSCYQDLSFDDKCAFVGVSKKVINKEYFLKKEEELLGLIGEGITFKELVEKGNVKTRSYLKNKLSTYIDERLIVCNGDIYSLNFKLIRQ